MSFHLGSAKAWRIAHGVLALLSFAAAIPLNVLSYQLGDAVSAAVIGIPCAAVGWVVARRQPVNPARLALPDHRRPLGPQHGRRRLRV
jgi:hypothetical protein